MRPALLGAFAALLPRLQAEESLRRVAELQAALPEYKVETRRRIVRAWERVAGEASAVRPRSETEARARLSMIGIKLQQAEV